MKIINTKFQGLKVIKGINHYDNRGYLREVFRNNFFKEKKLIFWILSKSKKNVVRGLHLQKKNKQGKYVSVLEGKIFDVAVDLRKNSKTFGKYFSITLSEKDPKSVFITPGFAHGFLVLSDSADFEYKCTEYYHPEDEHCLMWNDPEVAIDWPINDPILSEQDKRGLSLKDL